MNEISQLASLSLSLHPLEERILEALASYPLLCTSQLALLLDADVSNVTKSCKKLQSLNLVESHRAALPERDASGRRIALAYYLLAPLAIRYLAAQGAVGSNIGVKRYVRARHWEHGFTRLLHQFKHTRVMNTFFVGMFKCARAHGIELDWQSEFDARIYFKSNYHYYFEPRPKFERKPQSHSRRGEWFRSIYRANIFALMPDGSGVVRTANAEYSFALEVDLTRSARDKLARKLHEYLLAQGAEKFGGAILVLTTSWQRARTWSNVARGILGLDEADLSSPEEQTTMTEMVSTMLPLWITTIRTLEEKGVAGPIWWNIWEGEELIILKWFR